MELGEIESAVRNYFKIEEAVVIARKTGNGELELVAYYVAMEEVTASDLKSHLKNILPYYMLPHHYVQLESMPLTLNGKVDKKKLPEPAGFGTGKLNKYLAPGNEIEVKLVEIWSEILQIEKEKISISDNFFELGGHSLKATRLISRIKREFEVEVKIRDIFMEPTIMGIAEGLSTLLWIRNEASVAARPDADTEKMIF